MNINPALTRAFILLLFISSLATAQASSGPAKGTLILTGGDQETALKEFVTLAYTSVTGT